MKFFAIDEAAILLGVSKVTARHLLGTPDKMDRSKYNRPVFFYASDHVQAVKQDRASSKSMRDEKTECCRICHKKHDKTELTGGRCNECRACLCLLNFCCHNCLNCDKFDKNLFSCMKNAMEKIEAENAKPN